MYYQRDDGWERRIIDLLSIENGLTDQEIAEKLNASSQIVGIVCRQLEYKGKLERIKIKGKMKENHLKIK